MGNWRSHSALIFEIVYMESLPTQKTMIKISTTELLTSSADSDSKNKAIILNIQLRSINGVVVAHNDGSSAFSQGGVRVDLLIQKTR